GNERDAALRVSSAAHNNFAMGIRIRIKLGTYFLDDEGAERK
ncbi:MAG: hypothetical protein QOH42_145, partial [Blastocatellia bacterium]|nr:hypothetical protein [Blastocatellia bacterium]